MRKIDLNADIGESFGSYKIGLDEEIIKQISSANIACGWHAGDPVVLEKTIGLAKEAGTSVGAHPGFPDLMGFGRRNMQISEHEAYTYTKYQIGAFYAFSKSAKLQIQHVKPHGALYNMAGADMKLATAICKAVREFDSEIILLGLSGSMLTAAAQELGMRTANEVFADRAYEADGSLVARSKEGAMIHDEKEAIERMIKLVSTGKITAITGEELSIKCDSICVHGDNAKAVQFTTQIKDRLTEAGIKIAPLNEIV